MPKLPSVSGERVVKALKRAGFVQLRQKGSHVSLEKRISDKADSKLFGWDGRCNAHLTTVFDLLVLGI